MDFKKKQKFSIRKLTLGVASVLIGTAITFGQYDVQAQTTSQVSQNNTDDNSIQIDYLAIDKEDLTNLEKDLIIYRNISEEQAVEKDLYVLVYQNVKYVGNQLPNTGSQSNILSLLAAGALLVVVYRLGRKKTTVLGIILLTANNLVSIDGVNANDLLQAIKTQVVSHSLQQPLEAISVPNYEYVGYIKDEDIPRNTSLYELVQSYKANSEKLVTRVGTVAESKNSESSIIKEETSELPKEPVAPTPEEQPEESVAPTPEEQPEESVAPTPEEQPEEPVAPTPEEQPEEPVAPTPEEQPEEPVTPTPEEQPEEPVAPTPEEQPIQKRKVTEEVTINFTTEYVDNPELPRGTEREKTKGEPGTNRIEYEVTYQDGKEVSRVKVGETVVKAPVTHVIERGTGVVRTEREVQVTREIDFKVVEETDSNAPVGSVVVKQEGVKGLVTDTYTVIEEDGKEVSRTLKGSEITRPTQDKIIVKGTRQEPTIRKESIFEEVEVNFTTGYVDNPELPRGTEREKTKGELGTNRIEYEVTYQDGKEVSRVKVGETVVKAPVTHIIERGTGPIRTEREIQVTREIDFNIIEESDPNALVGSVVVKQEGVKGLVTDTYTVIEEDGKEVSRILKGSEITRPTQDKIIVKGTRQEPIVRKESIFEEVEVNFTTEYVDNPELPRGTEREKTKGEPGTNRIEYEVTYQDGKEVSRVKVGETVVKAPVTHIIERGTGPVRTEREVQVTREIDFEVIEETDPTALVGSEVVKQKGVKGEVVDTYTVIEEDGQEVSRTLKGSETTREVQNEIIVRGTRQPIDWTRLRELISEEEEILASDKYLYDTPEDKQAYERQIALAKELEVRIKAATVPFVTQEEVNTLVAAIEDKKIRLDGERINKTKPTLRITELLEDDLAKTITVNYQLDDPTQSFVSAITRIYDGERLVKEVTLSKDNLMVQFNDLDYFKPYTVKTDMVYQLENQSQTEQLTDIRQAELELKKIEFKDIDSVTLYKIENGTYRRQLSLNSVPGNLTPYVVKIKSDLQKEIELPVSKIEDGGEGYYNVTVSTPELVQAEGEHYKADYSFKVAKATQSTEGVYTSFKALLEAIRQNPAGTYTLGADMTADEVSDIELSNGYFDGEFTGTLRGEHNGKAYAIYNLRQPLFNTLSGATVEHVDLKDVAITLNTGGHGSLAKKAKNSTLSDISVQGVIEGVRNLGGLVYSVTNTNIQNVHFDGRLSTTQTDKSSSEVGGIVGRMDGGLISKANANVSVNVYNHQGHHRAGAIVGHVLNGRVEKSVASGEIVNRANAGQVGGLIGSVWRNGVADQLVTAVKVTNGNMIYGDSGHANARLTNISYVEDVASGKQDKWSIQAIASEQVNNKVVEYGITTTLENSGELDKQNMYSVDYTTLPDSIASRRQAYENIAKLMPFYNKELIVRYGNKVAATDKLANTALVDVVPMNDDEIVTNVHAEKQAVNRIMLYFADGTVEYRPVSFKEDFRNNRIAEYTVAGTELLYTPEEFLSDYSNIVNAVLPSLQAVNYDSDEVRRILDIPILDPSIPVAEGRKLAYLYLQDSFEEVKRNLPNLLRELFSMDKAINTESRAADEVLIKRIKDDPIRFMLSLSYLNRWYNIQVNNVNTKELTMFKHDFFGNQSASVIDTIFALGQAGYDGLAASQNVETFANVLALVKGKEDVFSYLESYRKLFAPNWTNNEWLKNTTKAYIVETKSTIPEVAAKQEAAVGAVNNPHSLGVYEKITASDWRHRNMLLPLLTLKSENMYIISNLNTISMGGYESYIAPEAMMDPAEKERVRELVNRAAKWQQAHSDYWYRVLPPEHREKLFRSVLNYDGFSYKESNVRTRWHRLEDSAASIQEFFGPVGKWYNNNGAGAYANGHSTHFVANRILQQYGHSLYTHEMVHNSDGHTYFYGYGRRTGVGAELYALGLLQNPATLDDARFGINTSFTADENSTTRMHAANPMERYQSMGDVNQYVKGMLDVTYVLDYLEAESILKQSDEFKQKWLQVIENYYIRDAKQGIETHAGNKMRGLTLEEAAQLRSLEDLIRHNTLSRRNYGYEYGKQLPRNDYYEIEFFSPIYASLSNDKGAPGDLMFRRMAFELWAAKGYEEGFLPYASNKYAKEAFDANERTYSNYLGEYIGRVTDKRVFDNIFQGEYQDWTAFKLAMFNERAAKFSKLKSATIEYDVLNANSKNKVTINSVDDIRRLMEEAIVQDAKNIDETSRNTRHSAVHRLKQRLYNAYLRETNDFRSSIFNP